MSSPLRSALSGALLLAAVTVTAFAAEDRIAFDLSAPGAPVDYKASGMLNGFQRGAPEDAALLPLKLQTVRLSQSTELPEETPASLYPRAVAAGATEVIQIVGDSVRSTNPTLSDPTHWKTYWVGQVTALASQAASLSQTYVWDIYNEPDLKIGVSAVQGTPCGPPASNPSLPMTDYNDWFSIWDQAYVAIRGVLPNAVITGPSYSSYNASQLEAFIDHCATAGTMPDIVNWHFGTITSYQTEANTIRAYAAGKGYTVAVMIGEAIPMGTDRNLDPGLAVTLFANAERANIRAVHASWSATPVAGIAQVYVPQLNGLLTPDTLLPRGAWWSYESYGALSGALLTADLSASTDLDGLASFDPTAHSAVALVGTMDKSTYTGGTGKVRFTQVSGSTGLLDANGYTHVKVERIPFSEGELTALPVIAEGDFKPSTGGTLEVAFSVSAGREAVKVTASLPTLASPSRPSPRIEGESLAATVIAGRTVAVLSDSPSSAGAFSKAALGAVGDWVQYVFSVAETGDYGVNVGYKADPSRAILQPSIDGTAVGNLIDQSTTNAGYPDASIGRCHLTAGNHTLTFTVTGKSATSSGYTTSLDYLRLTPLSPIEAENLTYTTSPASTAGPLTDSLASDGKLIFCNWSASGSTIDFSVPVAAPGLYELRSAVKTFTSRGIYQVSVDGVNEGAPVDAYATTPAIQVTSHGFVTFTTAGIHDIRLTITGKNPSSTGYTAGVDYFTLEPANLDTIALGTAMTITGSSGASASTVSTLNARGGAYSKLTMAGPGEWGSYAFTVPDAGLYFLAVRYATGPDGGQFQMSVDGSSLYSSIDTYAYSVGLTEVGVGALQLTAGTHQLTFTTLGQSDCSTGFALGLDALRVSRLDSVTPLEAESVTPAVTNGSWSVVAYPGASGGSYVDAALASVGDSVSFPFLSMPAGVYRLETGYLAGTAEGHFTALANGYTVGRNRTSTYASPSLMRGGTDPNTDFGSFVLTGAGSPTFTYKCESTGGSGSTDVGIDYLSLAKYTRDR